MKHDHQHLHLYYASLCLYNFFSSIAIHLDLSTANQLVAVRGGLEDAKGVINKCFSKKTHTLLDFKFRLHNHMVFSSYGELRKKMTAVNGLDSRAATKRFTAFKLLFGGVGGEISHSLLNLSCLTHLNLKVLVELKT